MEFPDLGKHCSESFCRQIDFLPVNCDACQKTFCSDHFTYSKHNCPSAYKKDVQVPVCPLCSAPVPAKRGEIPDVAVSLHIDNDCASDPAVKKRKIYTNRCSKKGCKVKELIPVNCDSCHLNHCLTHRHPQDHNCEGPAARPGTTRAGLAALQRMQGSKPNQATSSSSSSRSANQWSSNSGRSASSTQSRAAQAASLQGNLSEDEALARALQASLSTSNTMTQEEIDREIAQALANSDSQPTPAARNQRTVGSCRVS